MTLLYIDWNLDPILIKTRFFELGYYGILFVTGIILGYLIVRKTYKVDGYPEESADRLLIYVALGILIGARLGHCIFYDFDYYIHNIWEIFLPFGNIDGKLTFIGYRGLASHGGAIGVILAVLLYSKRYKEKFWSIIDRIAVVTPLAGTFIRLGNLCNSEIIGMPSTLPFAFIFHRVDEIPRHPSQLYEAIAYIFIFVLLLTLFIKYRKEIKQGFFFGLSIFLIFIARFFIEFTKENQSAFEEGMTINMGQILSIPFIIIGAIMVIYCLSFYRKRSKKHRKK